MRRPAAVHELESGQQHTYAGKNQISNLAFIYLSRNFIVFILNIVYLYIQFRSIILFLKFSKFVILKFLKFRNILMY